MTPTYEETSSGNESVDLVFPRVNKQFKIGTLSAKSDECLLKAFPTRGNTTFSDDFKVCFHCTKQIIVTHASQRLQKCNVRYFENNKNVFPLYCPVILRYVYPDTKYKGLAQMLKTNTL